MVLCMQLRRQLSTNTRDVLLFNCDPTVFQSTVLPLVFFLWAQDLLETWAVETEEISKFVSFES